MHFSSGSMVLANQSQAVQVTHVYACDHSATRAAQAGDTSNLSFSETACPAPACQAIPMSVLLGDRGVPEVLRTQVIGRGNESIRVATHVYNATLNRLGECSPMLWDKMNDVALGELAMINVMKYAATSQRADYLDAYLGIKSFVQLLSTFQGLCAVRAPAHHICFVADQITEAIAHVEVAKENLLEAAEDARSAVLMPPLWQANTVGSWFRSFDRKYGIWFLEHLRSAPQGLYILSLPITKTNILASHAFCVARAPSWVQEMQERAAARQETNMGDLLGEISTSVQNYNRAWRGRAALTMQVPSRDIRALRPARVLSSKLAAARQVMRVRIEPKSRAPARFAVRGDVNVREL